MILLAERKTYSTVLLTWDGHGSDTRYIVYRQLADGGDFEKIATTYSTAYKDESEGVSLNEFITYRVDSPITKSN